MKKTLFTILFLGVFVMGITTPSFSEENEYHYSWMTTCGVTVHITLPYELTDEQCADLMDLYEDMYCGTSNVGPESDIQD